MVDIFLQGLWYESLMKASHEKYYLSALGITILLLFFFSLEWTIDSIPKSTVLDLASGHVVAYPSVNGTYYLTATEEFRVKYFRVIAMALFIAYSIWGNAYKKRVAANSVQ